jgi:NDP-sugar pyrophosphorylase family protein
MMDFHEGGHFHATMGLRPYTHQVAFGCAEVSGDRLVGLVEKPVLEKKVNAGVYILSPEAVKSVPADTMYPITRLFEDALSDGYHCGAYMIGEDWADIGQPQQLREARGMD